MPLEEAKGLGAAMTSAAAGTHWSTLAEDQPNDDSPTARSTTAAGKTTDPLADLTALTSEMGNIDQEKPVYNRIMTSMAYPRHCWTGDANLKMTTTQLGAEI